MQTTLETERLVLRPPEASDADRIALLAGDCLVAETTLNVPHPYRVQDALSFIEQISITADHHTCAIIRREDNLLIGMIGLRAEPRHQRAELGYWIGVPYWKQGYATEAAHALIKYGFDVLQLRRIHAAFFAHNVASGRVMAKIGMCYEGTLRQHHERWGAFHDSVVYGILREDYTER